MYKLKYANVRCVVSTEKEKEELIKQGYSLYEQDVEEEEEQAKDEIAEEYIQEPVEETEEPKEAKKGRGRNGK